MRSAPEFMQDVIVEGFEAMSRSSRLDSGISDILSRYSQKEIAASVSASTSSCPTLSCDLLQSDPIIRICVSGPSESEVADSVTTQNVDSSSESSGNKRNLDFSCSKKVNLSEFDGQNEQTGKRHRLEVPCALNPEERHNDGRLTSSRNGCTLADETGSTVQSEKWNRSKQSHNTLPLTRVGMLAQPEDSLVLNALHVFVRQQIEIFTASQTEIAQPAPGRKTAIRLHQVGLRCIHCKTLPHKDRVKRATCYPSSIGRVYHSVSDMKFDHFPNCKGISSQLRSKFLALRAERKRFRDKQVRSCSSFSTAQYYHDSALRMGMEDRREGIFMSDQSSHSSHSLIIQAGAFVGFSSSNSPSTLNRNSGSSRVSLDFKRSEKGSCFSIIPGYHFSTNGRQTVSPSLEVQVSTIASHPQTKLQSNTVAPRPREWAVLLETRLDEQYLNPLHCFVRRHVEVFVATKEDIAAPCPGRKNRVGLGQVGIRCIHCAKLSPKGRVKRAVCYPPSVSAIYHAVSNMKFDHFGSCRSLPEDARREFLDLRSSFSRKGGSSSKSSRGMPNSTAQYYHDSALRLGLIDSDDGIRLVCPFFNEVDRRSIARDGISALVLASRDPLLQAECEKSPVKNV